MLIPVTNMLYQRENDYKSMIMHINPNHIIAHHKGDEHYYLEMTDKTSLRVKESANEINDLIKSNGLDRYWNFFGGLK